MVSCDFGRVIEISEKTDARPLKDSRNETLRI